MREEYVYAGDEVPKISEEEHAEFLLNVQRAILYSLEKKNLLTRTQRDRCLAELEKRAHDQQKKQRRV